MFAVGTGGGAQYSGREAPPAVAPLHCGPLAFALMTSSARFELNRTAKKGPFSFGQLVACPVCVSGKPVCHLQPVLVHYVFRLFLVLLRVHYQKVDEHSLEYITKK